MYIVVILPGFSTRHTHTITNNAGERCRLECCCECFVFALVPCFRAVHCSQKRAEPPQTKIFWCETNLPVNPTMPSEQPASAVSEQGFCMLDRSRDTVREGDCVVLYANKKSIFPVKLKRDKRLNCEYGVFPHNDVIGRRYGEKVLLLLSLLVPFLHFSFCAFVLFSRFNVSCVSFVLFQRFLCFFCLVSTFPVFLLSCLHFISFYSFISGLFHTHSCPILSSIPPSFATSPSPCCCSDHVQQGRVAVPAAPDALAVDALALPPHTNPVLREHLARRVEAGAAQRERRRGDGDGERVADPRARRRRCAARTRLHLRVPRPPREARDVSHTSSTRLFVRGRRFLHSRTPSSLWGLSLCSGSLNCGSPPSVAALVSPSLCLLHEAHFASPLFAGRLPRCTLPLQSAIHAAVVFSSTPTHPHKHIHIHTSTHPYKHTNTTAKSTKKCACPPCVT